MVLSHQVPKFNVKYRLILGALVPALAYYDTVSSVVEDVPSAAFCVLQRILASDHLGSTEKVVKAFCLYSVRMELCATHGYPKSFWLSSQAVDRMGQK